MQKWRHTNLLWKDLEKLAGLNLTHFQTGICKYLFYSVRRAIPSAVETGKILGKEIFNFNFKVVKKSLSFHSFIFNGKGEITI